MFNSIDRLIEKNHADIRDCKKMRNVSILKSAGFAALFAAGLIWHEEAVDSVEKFQSTNIPITYVNEVSLNIFIGASIPFSLLELGSAGIAQYRLRQNQRFTDSLHELQESLSLNPEVPQNIIASESRDKLN